MKISKKDLITATNCARKYHFESKYEALLKKMQEAADKGENYIIFSREELNNEFMAWLVKETFTVYGLLKATTNQWQRINNPSYTLDIISYDAFMIIWEE